MLNSDCIIAVAPVRCKHVRPKLFLERIAQFRLECVLIFQSELLALPLLGVDEGHLHVRVYPVHVITGNN